MSWDFRAPGLDKDVQQAVKPCRVIWCLAIPQCDFNSTDAAENQQIWSKTWEVSMQNVGIWWCYEVRKVLVTSEKKAIMKWPQAFNQFAPTILWMPVSYQPQSHAGAFLHLLLTCHGQLWPEQPRNIHGILQQSIQQKEVGKSPDWLWLCPAFLLLAPENNAWIPIRDHIPTLWPETGLGDITQKTEPEITAFLEFPFCEAHRNPVGPFNKAQSNVVGYSAL